MQRKEIIHTGHQERKPTKEREIHQLFDVSKLIKGQSLVFDNLNKLAFKQNVFKDINPDLLQNAQSELERLRQFWAEKYQQILDSINRGNLPWSKKEDVIEGNCISLSLSDKQSIIIKDFRTRWNTPLHYGQTSLHLTIHSPTATIVSQPDLDINNPYFENLKLRFYTSRRGKENIQTNEIMINEKNIKNSIPNAQKSSLFNTLVINGLKRCEPPELNEDRKWHGKTVDDYPPIKTDQSFRITVCSLPEDTFLTQGQTENPKRGK